MLSRITYLAPIYKPAIGGCVAYLSMLMSGLIDHGSCDSFRIITERYPHTEKSQELSGGRIQIVRTYPFRAGKSTKDFSSYLAYLIQQLQLLGLIRLLTDSSVLFIHGSF